ncbi:MAG: NAD-dependent epimerase/dehydratase family protein [Acidobacteria bacterium]|nr:NAD-dependent epimerase/dehydratase family protein [Acidobacteriota bacterium]
MKVFLTGATGYIGSAVLDALLKGGHAVTALVRDREKAARVGARGVEPIVGSLSAPDGWRDAADGQDAIIHTALDYSGNGPESDRLAVDTILSVAPPLFIYTSGVWVLGAASSAADESAPLTHPAPFSAWRVEQERAVLSANRAGHRTLIVRPGIVYGGARGIVSDMLRDATNGIVRVIGDGTNHWPLVYDRDLAELYARLLVAPEAAGVYHATDDADETVNEIVEAMRAAVPQPASLRHVPLPEARKKLGAFGDALALDQIVRSTRSRAIGWAPALRSVSTNIPRLLEELRRGDAQ